MTKTTKPNTDESAEEVVFWGNEEAGTTTNVQRTTVLSSGAGTAHATAVASSETRTAV